MNPHRPVSVTFFCTLIILGGLGIVTAVAAAMYASTDSDYLTWLEAHRIETIFYLSVVYTYAAITLTAGYFMLQAKNWARWLYLITGAVTLALWIWALSRGWLYSALPIVRESLFYVLALTVLFQRGAREFFAAGGRPWWQREQE